MHQNKESKLVNDEVKEPAVVAELEHNIRLRCAGGSCKSNMCTTFQREGIPNPSVTLSRLQQKVQRHSQFFKTKECDVVAGCVQDWLLVRWYIKVKCTARHMSGCFTL
jgi:hypothetical protein